MLQGWCRQLVIKSILPAPALQSMKRRRMYTLIVVLAGVMVTAIAGTFFLSLTARRPSDLGVHNGRLSDVPSSPNCVSTSASTTLHGIQPLAFEGDPAKALEKVRDIVSTMSRTTLVETMSDYLHVEFRSQIFRFVDDVEFLRWRTNDSRWANSPSSGGTYRLSVYSGGIELCEQVLGEM